jgi:hypothetical protein
MEIFDISIVGSNQDFLLLKAAAPYLTNPLMMRSQVIAAKSVSPRGSLSV